MSNELQMGNSLQNITQNENLRAKDTAPLPKYNRDSSNLL